MYIYKIKEERNEELWLDQPAGQSDSHGELEAEGDHADGGSHVSHLP